MLADDRGSTPVEFVLVGILLTALTLAVLQLGLIVYVRNVVHDAAVEGAHRAALADATFADGVARTRQTIVWAVGESYAQDISAAQTNALGVPTVEVTVRADVPIIGLISIPVVWEVTGRAPIESFDAP